MLCSTPGAAIWPIHDLQYPIFSSLVPNWEAQTSTSRKSNIWENKSRIDFNYRIKMKVLLISEGIDCKAEDKDRGPVVIT